METFCGVGGEAGGDLGLAAPAIAIVGRETLLPRRAGGDGVLPLLLGELEGAEARIGRTAQRFRLLVPA